MEIIAQTTEFHIPHKTAVAIGKFDGIHLGHQKLLGKLLALRERGLRTAVFTFDPSPSVFFGHGTEKELMTVEEKRKKFAQMGVDYLVEYPFCVETASISPEDYVNRILIKQMNVSHIVAGEDVTFGDKGAGNAEMLCKLADAASVHVSIIDKLCHNGREISSTYVREAVCRGDMELAAYLLGQPFFVSGTVQRGNQIGRTIGLPTVNIHPGDCKIMPPNGVYFSTVTYEHQTYYGVTNVGYKPTVEEKRRLGVETFLFDFEEDIYGKDIVVFLHHFTRPEMKFESLNALKEAILRNVAEAKLYFLRNDS